mgnify:CR=1 FL=1
MVLLMNVSELISGANAWGLSISEKQAEQFSLYGDLLLSWNRKFNLTRITEPSAVCRQHFLDSIAPMLFVDFSDRSLIDIGTGAGFPGIPLKIMNPSLKLTLLDALDKRCLFLREVAARLRFNEGDEKDEACGGCSAGSVKILHGRAEDFAASKEEKSSKRGKLKASPHLPEREIPGEPGNALRGSFDFAVSRAVAKLNILCEYAVPFLKIGGQFIAYKLDNRKVELDDAAYAMLLLGASCADNRIYTLPDVAPARALCFIKKDSATSEKYPRRAGIPEKKPL